LGGTLLWRYAQCGCLKISRPVAWRAARNGGAPPEEWRHSTTTIDIILTLY